MSSSVRGDLRVLGNGRLVFVGFCALRFCVRPTGGGQNRDQIFKEVGQAAPVRC